MTEDVREGPPDDGTARGIVSSPGRAVGAVCALAVLGSGSYGAIFWLARDTGPPPERFVDAARVIREGHREGDLIFLVPFYATRAREHLGDLHPLAVRDPLSEDLATHPRVWVFGLFGEGRRVGGELLKAGFTREVESEPVPGITVDRFRTNASMVARYSFLEHIRSARVHHEKDGTRTPCASWSETNGQGGPLGRWVCPYDSEWFYVAPEWHRMGEHLRLCLWAHPPNQGRLVISFPNVPLTGQLYGRAGHTLNASLHARAPIYFDVEIGDHAQRFTFDLLDHDRPFILSTRGTGTATVSFAVSTPDAGANHFCFDAEMRASLEAKAGS